MVINGPPEVRSKLVPPWYCFAWDIGRNQYFSLQLLLPGFYEDSKVFELKSGTEYYHVIVLHCAPSLVKTCHWKSQVFNRSVRYSIAKARKPNTANTKTSKAMIIYWRSLVRFESWANIIALYRNTRKDGLKKQGELVNLTIRSNFQSIVLDFGWSSVWTDRSKTHYTYWSVLTRSPIREQFGLFFA